MQIVEYSLDIVVQDQPSRHASFYPRRRYSNSCLTSQLGERSRAFSCRTAPFSRGLPGRPQIHRKCEWYAYTEDIHIHFEGIDDTILLGRFEDDPAPFAAWKLAPLVRADKP